MFERLQALYRAGRLDDAGLQSAVSRAWITQAQADQILSGEEPAP